MVSKNQSQAATVSPTARRHESETPTMASFLACRDRQINQLRERIVAHEERWNILAKAMGPNYADKDLATWELFGDARHRRNQQCVLRALKEFRDTIPAKVAAGVNLIFAGPIGTGKDFMMADTLRCAVKTYGKFARWRNGIEIFSEYRATMNPKSTVTEPEFIKKLTEIQILAISDLLPPIGSLTDFQAGLMFDVIDTRYRQGLPTWLTLNVEDTDEAKRRLGSQIVDRLFHRPAVMFCDWPSYREHEGRKA